MEVMTRDEFWARCPAPDTKFVEIDSVSRVTAHAIDPLAQEPDDIIAVSYSPNEDDEVDMIVVLSWGSWDEHQESIQMHNEAVSSMKKDDNIVHQCEIGLKVT